jgi:hypothetical protein
MPGQLWPPGLLPSPVSDLPCSVIASRTVRPLAIAASSPLVMMLRSPFAARMVPPETGASTSSGLFWSEPSRCERTSIAEGGHVDERMTVAPGARTAGQQARQGQDEQHDETQRIRVLTMSDTLQFAPAVILAEEELGRLVDRDDHENDYVGALTGLARALGGRSTGLDKGLERGRIDVVARERNASPDDRGRHPLTHRAQAEEGDLAGRRGRGRGAGSGRRRAARSRLGRLLGCRSARGNLAAAQSLEEARERDGCAPFGLCERPGGEQELLGLVSERRRELEAAGNRHDVGRLGDLVGRRARVERRGVRLVNGSKAVPRRTTHQRVERVDLALGLAEDELAAGGSKHGRVACRTMDDFEERADIDARLGAE